MIGYEKIKSAFYLFFGNRNYECLPSFPLVSHDPTVFFTNASITPFKTRLIEDKQINRTALMQNCFRAQKDPSFLFYFKMLGLLAHIDDLAHVSKDFMTFIIENLEFKLERLHVIYDPLDIELKNICEDLFDRKNQHVQSGNNNLHWTRWKFGAGERLQGRGCTISYESEQKIPCSNQCNVQCSCGYYFPLGNIIALNNKYIEIGIGVESLMAAKEFGSYFNNPPFLPAVAFVQDFFSYDETKTQMFINNYIGACALIENMVLPTPRGSGYVLRKLIRNQIKYLFNLNHHENIANTFQKITTTLIPILKEEYSQETFKKIVHFFELEYKCYINNLKKSWKHIVKKSNILRRKTPENLLKLLKDTYGFPDLYINQCLNMINKA